MNRRGLIGLAVLAAGATFLGGHTPYGQWVVYRKKHLLIGCHKADPKTYDLAKRVVALLRKHLPEAKSRVARAPNAGRLASLLGTGQMEVATVSSMDAAAMLHGTGRFDAYGPIQLRMLTPIGSRLLVARADFPERHAWLVVRALMGSELAPRLERPSSLGVPWHPGSLAYLDGRPEPSDN